MERNYRYEILGMIERRLKESVHSSLANENVQKGIFMESLQCFPKKYNSFSSDQITRHVIGEWMRADRLSDAPAASYGNLLELGQHLQREGFEVKYSGWYLSVSLDDTTWRFLRRDEGWAYGLLQPSDMQGVTMCVLSTIREDSFTFIREVESSLPALIGIVQETVDLLSIHLDEDGYLL